MIQILILRYSGTNEIIGLNHRNCFVCDKKRVYVLWIHNNDRICINCEFEQIKEGKRAELVYRY